MTSPKFTIKDGEHGSEYFEGDIKLAFTNAAGSLQFTRGNAERRDEVEAWIKRHEAHTPAASEQPTGDAPSSADEVLSEYNEEAKENVIADQAEQAPEQPLPIICPIVGASHLGDKDPAVYNWWFKNHPEMAKARYAGRRVQTESGIIV